MLMPLDVLLSIGIIGLVIAVLIPHYETAARKAELSRIFSTFGNEKPERMIEMALTGEGYYPGQPAPDLGGSMLPESMPQFFGGRAVRKAAGSTLRFEGQAGAPYLTFAPTVVAEGPIGTVMWLCGNRKPPAGWTQPANTGTDLQPAMIPYICRN